MSRARTNGRSWILLDPSVFSFFFVFCSFRFVVNGGRLGFRLFDLFKVMELRFTVTPVKSPPCLVTETIIITSFSPSPSLSVTYTLRDAQVTDRKRRSD